MRNLSISLLAGLALLALTMAGCVGGDGDDAQGPAVADQLRPDGTIDHDAIARHIGEPITIDHDHLNHGFHQARHNMEFLAWSDLGVTLGANGFANFVFHETPGADGNLGTSDDRLLAFVAIDGDEAGGFIIADITEVDDIQILGSVMQPGNGFQEVRVTPDGRYAVLNVQDLPTGGTVGDGLATGAGATVCSFCLHFYDIADLRVPRHAGAVPVEVVGSHNMEFVAYDDGLYLFYVAQPAYVAGAGMNPPLGNEVKMARVVEAPDGSISLANVASLRLVSAYPDPERSFPHDVLVFDHPDGRRLAYVSHWQGGMVLFDVSTVPATATGGEAVLMPLGVYDDPAPSEVSNIHWTWQESAPRAAGPAAGKTIAWSAPEIGALASGSGVIRSYDVTDPSAPTQLGTWGLPGNVTISDRFIFSGHTAIPDESRGLLAVAHYHAGVWILDASDPSNPKALGFYLPHGDPGDPYDGPIWWKKPNFSPDGFGPNVYQARWAADGTLWVTDRGTGLYALRYTGPVPGPLADAS